MASADLHANMISIFRPPRAAAPRPCLNFQPPVFLCPPSSPFPYRYNPRVVHARTSLGKEKKRSPISPAVADDYNSSQPPPSCIPRCSSPAVAAEPLRTTSLLPISRRVTDVQWSCPQAWTPKIAACPPATSEPLCWPRHTRGVLW